MPDSERFERDPAEGSRSTVDRQLTDSAAKPSENGGVPAETFPSFDDPGNSPAPAGSPVKPTDPDICRSSRIFSRGSL
jgi:hypothetical protein